MNHCKYCRVPVYLLLGQWRHRDSNAAEKHGHTADPAPPVRWPATDRYPETIRRNR